MSTTVAIFNEFLLKIVYQSHSFFCDLKQYEWKMTISLERLESLTF
jgi:hypothetical protein